MSRQRNAALPHVVACVPTWNAEPFIRETLIALSRQTYPNLRIMVSDDCSTDGTIDICRRVARTDQRIEVSRQPRNVGWVNNVNTLLRMAAGDYLFIAAHDDLLRPDFVAVLVHTLEQTPEAILAYSDMDTSFANGGTENGIYRQLDGVKSPVVRAAKILLQMGEWWIPYRGIFRASVLDKNPGLEYNQAGEFSADWSWLVGLALEGRFVRVPATLCHKIYKEDSLSRRWNFTLAAWIAADIACVRVVHRSPIPAPHKIILYLFALLFIPLQAVGLFRSYLKRL